MNSMQMKETLQDILANIPTAEESLRRMDTEITPDILEELGAVSIAIEKGIASKQFPIQYDGHLSNFTINKLQNEKHYTVERKVSQGQRQDTEYFVISIQKAL